MLKYGCDLQAAGIGLAFLCLPLAGNEPLRLGRGIKNALKGIIWGLLLFAAYGVTDFVFKIQAELAPAADHKAFMATIFGTALVHTLPRLLDGTRISRRCEYFSEFFQYPGSRGVKKRSSGKNCIMTANSIPVFPGSSHFKIYRPFRGKHLNYIWNCLRRIGP